MSAACHIGFLWSFITIQQTVVYFLNLLNPTLDLEEETAKAKRLL